MPTDKHPEKVIIFSMLTESNGHLILDDEFWFGGLSSKSDSVKIVTSKASSRNLKIRFPKNPERILSFREFNFIKKISFRLHLILKILFAPRFSKSTLILQGYDELGFFFLNIKYLFCENKILTVPTNNISIERFNRSPKALEFFTKFIIRRSHFFFYHSRFEFEMIKNLLNGYTSQIKKLVYLKYHLIGKNSEIGYLESDPSIKTISIFGPELEAKPLGQIINLINKDDNFLFEYHFYNFDNSSLVKLNSLTSKSRKIFVHKSFMAHEKYLETVSKSYLVFLPHNKLYEGKISGILSDCIALSTPIISNLMEPIIDFFEKYGDFGFMYDFENDSDWTNKFFLSIENINYRKLKESLKKCKEDHSEESIINDFYFDISLLIKS